MTDENNNKKTQEHSYGWHTAREYEPYINAVIGLKMMTLLMIILMARMMTTFC